MSIPFRSHPSSGAKRSAATAWPLGWALLAALALPVVAAGQTPETVPPDPDVLRKDGFDADRAIFWAERNFDPLRDPEFQSLADALEDGHVSRETPVLTFEAGGETLVLITSQMSYHHVAQGEIAGEPWMVTF